MSQNSQTNIQKDFVKSQIGVIGLAVMGANLARNLASKGFRTSIFNRTFAKTQDLLDLQKSEKEKNSQLEQKSVVIESPHIEGDQRSGGIFVDNANQNLAETKTSQQSKTPPPFHGAPLEARVQNGNLIGFETLEEFVESLESPRKIILMVKSGIVVDEFLDKLKPLLNPEDIVMDCGNSNWKDTQRRQKDLEINVNSTENLQNSLEVSQNSSLQRSGNEVNGVCPAELSSKLNSPNLKSKTIHLIGIFCEKNLENWAKIIKTTEPKFDKIILHLITQTSEFDNQKNEQNTGQNDITLVKTWQKFTEILNFKSEKNPKSELLESQENLENKIILGSLGGINFAGSSEIDKVKESLEVMFQIRNLTYEPFYKKLFPVSHFFSKDLVVQEGKDSSNYEYSQVKNFYIPHFGSKSEFDNTINELYYQSKVAQLATVIEINFEEDILSDSDLRPIAFDSVGFRAYDSDFGIKPNDTIYVINNDRENEKNLGKFTEILEDLNSEFELNLEILVEKDNNNLNFAENGELTWQNWDNKPKVLFASNNNHKIRLFKTSWNNQGLDQKFELITPSDLPKIQTEHIEENSGSFAGDALIKAQSWAKIYNLPTISQDRGFIFEALNWPGTDSKKVMFGDEKKIYNSQNWESEKTDNLERAKKVLTKIDGKNRNMTVIQALAIVLPNGEFVVEEKINPGIASEQVIDKIGGAFDWFFIPKGLNHTLSQFATKEQKEQYEAENLYPITPKIIDFLTNLNSEFELNLDILENEEFGELNNQKTLENEKWQTNLNWHNLEIRNGQIILKIVCENDFINYQRIWSKQTPEEIKVIILRDLEWLNCQKAFKFSIFDQDNFVGVISLRDLDTLSPEFGLWILSEFRNKNLATIALQTFLEWIWKNLTVKKIYYKTGIENLASQKVAQKCYFVKENTHEIRKYSDKSEEKLLIFSLENPESKTKIEDPKQLFHLISCGVSGGEEGALNGPSIMPSGEPQIVNQILPMLEKIAARDFENQPCVTNVGLGPSGHFVKMVHNGIEYALMQGIAEIYGILRYNCYSNKQIREVFIELNQGKLKSFLLDITIKILETKDKDGEFLLDKIKDQAGSKGTGSWTVEAALEFGVAVPTIAAAVFARSMSARNQSFNANKKTIKSINIENIHEHTDYQKRLNSEDLFKILQKLLYSTFLVSYLQGLDLIIHADNFYKWKIDISEVCRIWQGGCIIRSEMLQELDQYFFGDKILSKAILFDPESGYNFLPLIDTKFQDVAIPVLNSVSDYILSIVNKNLPTNLIQAQRDFFGAHTFERIDKSGTFSGGWEK